MKITTNSTKLFCLLALSSLAGMAQTITCTFQFSASGTIGTKAFTNATVMVTTVGSTANRQPNGQAGYYIINDSASISISGVGAFQFTVPIFTYVATPGNNAPGTGRTLIGFGDAQSGNFTSNAGLVDAILSGFNSWNMLDSIAPIQTGGSIVQWNRETITTTGGTANLFDGNPQAITFQAAVSGTTPIPPTRSGVLSHVAAGGGWTTAITLVNTSTTAVPVTVGFHGDDGSPLILPFTTTQQGTTQTLSSASVSGTISPNATLLITTGALASTVVGWAEIDSASLLGGYAIFRQTPQTGSPSEGTVPLQTQFPSTTALSFDNTAGFVMGVALANLSASSANVTASVWDDSGNQIGTQNIAVAGNGHTAFVLPTLIPQTAGKRGIVKFQSGATGGLAGIGLRFSPFGTFTSVPTL